MNLFRRASDVPGAIPFFIFAVVVSLYLPFLFLFQDIALTQIENGVESRFSLPVSGSDSTGYVYIADNLMAGNGFSGSETEPYTPDTLRTILYPAFIALVKAITGSHVAIALFQMFLVALTAINIYLVSKSLWGWKLGLVSALLLVVEPGVIFHSQIVMSDTLFVFLFTLEISVIFFWQKNSYYSALLGGLLLALATLTRPIATYSLLFIIPFYFYLNHKKLSTKDILIRVVIIITVCGALVFPWLLRNKYVSGVWGLSATSSYNLFNYYIPEYLAYKNSSTADTERSNLRQELYEDSGMVYAGPGASELGNSSKLDHVSFKHLRENFFGYGFFHILKTAPVFLSSSLEIFFSFYNATTGTETFSLNSANMTDYIIHGDILGLVKALKDSPWIALEQICWVLVFFLMLCSLLHKEHRKYVVLLLCVIFYFAILTGSVAYSRFRLPLLPFMFMLVPIGFTAIKARICPNYL